VRIVLDACVPAGLARFLRGHDVTTVSRLFGSSDLDDGPLLDGLADRCDVFVTVDKSIQFQQNLRGRPFPVVLLRAHSNSLEHLVPLVPQLLAVVETARPGDLRVVGV
jgi:predicted nuclease of predicted toxin-antitoxin system